MRRGIQILVDAMLIFAVIALVPFAWLMRDGLGPDAGPSSGSQAVSRWFMTFYSGPVVIGLAALAVLCHCTGRSKQAKPAGQ